MYEKLYRWHIKQATKYKKKIKDQRSAEWYQFKVFNKRPFICGIDGKLCTNHSCLSKEYFEKYGCIYIQGFKKY